MILPEKLVDERGTLARNSIMIGSLFTISTLVLLRKVKDFRRLSSIAE